jgi:hypothetical protein
MTRNKDDIETDGTESNVKPAVVTPTAYKILGEIAQADAAAVLGKNTDGASTNYGVFGLTESSARGSAGVVGKATNGTTAVKAETTGRGDAILATTSGEDYNGVFGENTATSGWSWGVRGDTDSTDANATGVKGKANATSGSPTGVSGETSGGADGAAGVRGEARAGTGDTFGVDGETSSTASGAAGVRGSSTNTNHGVEGRVYDDASNLPTLGGGESAGVFGRSDKENGWAVNGWSRNYSAVLGRTDDVDSVGLFGYNSASGGVGVRSQGILEVTEHVETGKTGLSAYCSTNQTISNSTVTTVIFDETNADHFAGYDTSTGVYTVRESGDYHVSFTIDWQTTFDAGTHISYELRINGSSSGGIQADTTVGTDGQRVCRNYSRTLFSLDEDDTLEVTVQQQSGGPADVWGSDQESYLTLYKVG